MERAMKLRSFVIASVLAIITPVSSDGMPNRAVQLPVKSSKSLRPVALAIGLENGHGAFNGVALIAR